MPHEWNEAIRLSLINGNHRAELVENFQRAPRIPRRGVLAHRNHSRLKRLISTIKSPLGKRLLSMLG